MSIYKLKDPRSQKIAAKNAANAMKLLNQMRSELMQLGLWANDHQVGQSEERTSFLLDKQIYIEEALNQLAQPGNVLPFPVRLSAEGLESIFSLVSDRNSLKRFLELVDSLYVVCMNDPLTVQRLKEKMQFDKKSILSQEAKQRQIENIKRKK